MPRRYLTKIIVLSFLSFSFGDESRQYSFDGFEGFRRLFSNVSKVVNEDLRMRKEGWRFKIGISFRK